MASAAAPCVLLLRVAILTGIVLAEPDLIPFFGPTWQNVCFWCVVAIATALYLAAALSNPGYVTNCPSSYLPILESLGLLAVTPMSQVKFKPPPSPRDGVTTLPLDRYDDTHMMEDQQQQQPLTFAGRQRQRLQEKRRRRFEHTGPAYRKVETRENDSSDDEDAASWETDPVSQENSRFVAVEVHDDDDGVASVASSSVGQPVSPWDEKGRRRPLRKDTESQSPGGQRDSENVPPPPPPPPRSDSQDDVEALYPKAPNTNEILASRHQGTSQAITDRPRPLLLVKKTLGQAGIPVDSSASASATVGTALTYAVSATAAAPAAAMGYAAAHLAVQARVVLGQQSGVARACETFGRHALNRRKVKVDKTPPDGRLRNSSSSADRLDQAVEQTDVSEMGQHQMRARGGGGEVELRSGLRRPESKPIGAALESVESPSHESQQQQQQPTMDMIQQTLLATARLDVEVAASDIILSYSQTLSKAKGGTPCQSNVGLRFCRSCLKYQPLRTKHCHECHRCVRTMDHHCPWLGNCVGEKNRFWFFWFLVAQTVELIWAMVEGVQAFNGARELSIDDSNIGKVIFLTIYLTVVFIVMLCLVIMVICLVGYHVFLAASNMTTWENIAWGHISYLQELCQNRGSPFSRGAHANLYVYCCPPGIIPAWLRRWVMPHPAYVPLYGPEQELVWEHGDQKKVNCCCFGDCEDCCPDC